MNIRELIDKIKLHPLCKKNLYPYTWLSGASTNVYPIEVYKPENRITLQWWSDRNCPAFIRWIESFDIVDKAQFWKSDGSCPSTIAIYCNSIKE